MNLIYAALLLHSGKKEINEENLKKVIDSTGEKVDDAQIKALVTALEGVNIDEAIQKSAMPTTVAAPPSQAEKEEKKKRKKNQKRLKRRQKRPRVGCHHCSDNLFLIFLTSGRRNNNI